MRRGSSSPMVCREPPVCSPHLMKEARTTMPPQESDRLLPEKTRKEFSSHMSFEAAELSSSVSNLRDFLLKRPLFVVVGVAISCLSVALLCNRESEHVGPYKLLECQEGESFFKHYDFWDGPDSLGSDGYNTYVGKARARELGLVNVTQHHDDDEDDTASYVYLTSKATAEGPRESIRLEGKRRFDRGLFVLDLAHMPAGCGVWPAFWLTDEANWPDNGEIDIVEGVNQQSVVKTALHTSESCSMDAQVPSYKKTGVWDSATGIPDTWTGQPNYKNKVEADNCVRIERVCACVPTAPLPTNSKVSHHPCPLPLSFVNNNNTNQWVNAPHQWANQGCVAVSTENGTIGEPLNRQGGGVFALEWDPANRYIRSWVFSRNTRQTLPSNLERAMRTASVTAQPERPDPALWGLPYAYFAIGEGTGCSADHFRQMRIVFNLAFCGTVAGNRFVKDCPVQAHNQPFHVSSDSTPSCNEWIASNPQELEEAYWKIRGVYVYERE